MAKPKETNSAVFRVVKNKNYTTMSNYHLRDTQLSLSAIGLLSKMLSLSDNWKYSEMGLVAICKEGKDYVHQRIKELEKHNYIQRKQIRDEKGRFAYEYVIYEIPPTVSPVLDLPLSAKPATEPPLQEKSPQLNKEELSKELLNNQEINKEDILFDKLWKIYPRKEKYKEAKEAFNQALKKTNYEIIQNSLTAYISYIDHNSIERQYIKYFSTWLKNECWNEFYSEENKSKSDYIYYNWWEDE